MSIVKSVKLLFEVSDVETKGCGFTRTPENGSGGVSERSHEWSIARNHPSYASHHE
jgi:hypothetical protein